MKKINLGKIVPVLITFLIVISNFSYVQADGASLWKEMRSQIDSFQSYGDKVDIDTSKVVDPFIGLTQILITIGAGVLVGVTTYMGIKYLTSGPDARAKLKIQLIGIVVAGFVIFGAYFVWRVVLKFANSVS